MSIIQLEHCVLSQKNATLDQIQLVHKALLDDQYGNYVIQHVLQYGRESDRDSLLAIIIEGNLLKLSRQKFASNVVEKLLKYGNSNQRNAIVREMLRVVYEGGPGQDGMGSTVVLLMVRDAYANYVVQTSIDVVPEGKEKRLLLQELKANEVQLVSCVALVQVSMSTFTSLMSHHFGLYSCLHSETTHLQNISSPRLAQNNKSVNEEIEKKLGVTLNTSSELLACDKQWSFLSLCLSTSKQHVQTSLTVF